MGGDQKQRLKKSVPSGRKVRMPLRVWTLTGFPERLACRRGRKVFCQ
jgi:hypothetical protein